MIFCREDIYEAMSRVRGENGKCGFHLDIFFVKVMHHALKSGIFSTLLMEVSLSAEVNNASKICCLFRDCSQSSKEYKTVLTIFSTLLFYFWMQLKFLSCWPLESNCSCDY